MKPPAIRGLRPPAGVVAAVLLVLLAGLFYWKAQLNYRTHDAVNSNFFSFWLSGHMVWTGESPYNAVQFEAGFNTYHASYRPSKILQYPLPLMYFMAPIGALPVKEAYFAWNLVCELIVALSVLILLRRQPKRLGLFILLSAALLFFGPVYLTLQIGAVGAISLLAIALAILCLESELPLLAGLTLTVTMLKPSQAIGILVLAALWFLMRKKWTAIAGMALGGLILLAIWLLRDPLGLVKFRQSSDFLLGHSLGLQSNVFSFAYLACGGSVGCMWVAGSVGLLLILAVGALLLWRNRHRWTDWEAFSLIIPLGFLCALYLYSYDQIVYVVPVVWIVATLLARYRSYVRSVIVLVAIIAVSLAALIAEAYTRTDLPSLATTVVVLGFFAWLQRSQGRPSAPSSA